MFLLAPWYPIPHVFLLAFCGFVGYFPFFWNAWHTTIQQYPHELQGPWRLTIARVKTIQLSNTTCAIETWNFTW